MLSPPEFILNGTKQRTDIAETAREIIRIGSIGKGLNLGSAAIDVRINR